MSTNASNTTKIRFICLCFLLESIATYSAQDKPNFIILYIDDMRYTSSWSESTPTYDDLGGFNLPPYDVPTPNIDAIRNTGLVIPRSYAGSPACSPSRFTLLTGRYAVRSEYAIDQTLASSSQSADGTIVAVKYAKLWGSHDSQYNIQTVLQNNGYYTGMAGKWHLMSKHDNGENLGCKKLMTTANTTLYNQCRNVIKRTQGFDVVDAFYHENICERTNTNYSHNPEWMVDVSQKFINSALQLEKPFFLYFAPTLAHSPNIVVHNVLNYSNADTPKGRLTGDEIPDQTGMATRDEIWQRTLRTMNETEETIVSRDNAEIHMITCTLWIDDAIGALVRYLKDTNIYNNTFIVIANDHGYDAKGTLYELGSRVYNFIRYPPLFGVEGHVLPDEFIVANYDLASVIFEVSNSTVPAGYMMDGTNWLSDAMDYINNPNTDAVSENECCNERYMDIYNSHAIVTTQNKYVFRATDETWAQYQPTYPYQYPQDLYPFMDETEQLYRLTADPTEQSNKIGSAPLKDVTFEMRAKMVNYIDDTCIAEVVSSCTKPQILDADIPGYTCKREIEVKKTFTVARNYDDMVNPNKTRFLTETEDGIPTSKAKACSLSDFAAQEYVYKFERTKNTKLQLTMLLCCKSGLSFGSKYRIWPKGYDGNSVYDENGYREKQQMFVSENTMQYPAYYSHHSLLFMIVMSVLGVCYLIQRNLAKDNIYQKLTDDYIDLPIARNDYGSVCV